jgi:hypothetical protein
MTPEDPRKEFDAKIRRRTRPLIFVFGAVAALFTLTGKSNGALAIAYMATGICFLLVWGATIAGENSHPFRLILRGLLYIISSTLLAFIILLVLGMLSGKRPFGL